MRKSITENQIGATYHKTPGKKKTELIENKMIPR